MEEIEKILIQIENSIEQPFVTARFGDNWCEHQKRMFDEGQISIEMLINLAWKQGRKSILLEKALRDYGK